MNLFICPQNEKLLLERNGAEDRLNKLKRANSDVRVRTRTESSYMSFILVSGSVLKSDRLEGVNSFSITAALTLMQLQIN